MNKVVDLIKNVEYNKQYINIVDSKGQYIGKDYNEWNCSILNLSKVCNTSEDFIEDTEEINKIADIMVSKFEDIFLERGIKATEDQLYFARETAKVVLGKSIDDVLAVIPAPCGFGKSTIKLLIVKYYISLYESNKSNEGIIIVGDRLKDLKDLQDDLKALSKYTILLQSWNVDSCLAGEKSQEVGMCMKCDEYNCPIKKQQIECKKYPIVLMTNARVREMGDSIDVFKKWDKEITEDEEVIETNNRTLLMIDEKPEILDVVKVNDKLMNEIGTYISQVNYHDNIDDKTELQSYWNDILNVLHEEFAELRQYGKRRIYVGNYNGKYFCQSNKDFMILFNKYCSKYLKELSSIHKVFTVGGFYVREGKEEFICTIGHKDLRKMLGSKYKTIIFDGSSLYDPQYLALYDEEQESDLRYLYIPNARTYENLFIEVMVNHKITKTEFNNKSYLKKACSEFLRKLDKELKGKIYPITYKEVSRLGNYCGDNYRSKIMKMDNGSIFHFGGTKGSNAMSEAVNMVQFGWEVMPDYEYVIQYLSCCVKFDNVLEMCRADYKLLESISNDLMVIKREGGYGFGVDGINRFKWLDIITKFFQEIHRTKLRQYDCEDNIKVILFKTEGVIIDMIKALFPGGTVRTNKEIIDCFTEAKTMDRKAVNGKEKTNPQLLLEYLNSLEGGIVVKAKDIIEGSGLTRKQFDRAKETNIDVRTWFDSHKGEKTGQYII